MDDLVLDDLVLDDLVPLGYLLVPARTRHQAGTLGEVMEVP